MPFSSPCRRVAQRRQVRGEPGVGETRGDYPRHGARAPSRRQRALRRERLDDGVPSPERSVAPSWRADVRIPRNLDPKPCACSSRAACAAIVRRATSCCGRSSGGCSSGSSRSRLEPEPVLDVGTGLGHGGDAAAAAVSAGVQCSDRRGRADGRAGRATACASGAARRSVPGCTPVRGTPRRERRPCSRRATRPPAARAVQRRPALVESRLALVRGPARGARRSGSASRGRADC